jgi:hypothetical protein
MVELVARLARREVDLAVSSLDASQRMPGEHWNPAKEERDVS